MLRPGFVGMRGQWSNDYGMQDYEYTRVNLAGVFESPDGRDQDALNSDRDNENRFRRGLDDVVNATVRAHGA